MRTVGQAINFCWRGRESTGHSRHDSAALVRHLGLRTRRCSPGAPGRRSRARCTRSEPDDSFGTSSEISCYAGRTPAHAVATISRTLNEQRFVRLLADSRAVFAETICAGAITVAPVRRIPTLRLTPQALLGRNQDQWSYLYCDQRRRDPLDDRALKQCWDRFTPAVPRKRWTRDLRCAPAIL
jgi:hypothetical protein